MTTDRFTEHMTAALHDDSFADQFRAAFEPVAREILDSERANAIRPWRTAVFWLGVGYGLMAILFIVLLAVTR